MTLLLEKTSYDDAPYALDCSERLGAFGPDVQITGTPTVVVAPETTPPLVASDITIHPDGRGVTMLLSGGEIPENFLHRDYHCQLRHSTNVDSTQLAEPFTVRVSDR